jgi:hypothetical protein
VGWQTNKWPNINMDSMLRSSFLFSKAHSKPTSCVQFFSLTRLI